MSPTRIRRAVQRRLGDDRERGMTLIEMLFSIMLFSIFIIMFMAAVLSVARTSAASIDRSSSATSVLNSFQDLDRSVRWADRINPPGAGSGKAWVEFHVPAAVSLTGVETCVQWRYTAADGVIQERSWPAANASASGTWGARSTEIQPAPTGYPATYPFQFTGSSSSSPMQKLTLSLIGGGTTTGSQTEIQTDILARNSFGAPASAVCNPTGYRS